MRPENWALRLEAQCPGWFVWYTRRLGYFATPAPMLDEWDGSCRSDWTIGPEVRPQVLRSAMRERYGWYDVCETCNELARICGHRQPEREKR